VQESLKNDAQIVTTTNQNNKATKLTKENKNVENTLKYYFSARQISLNSDLVSTIQTVKR